MKSITKAFAFFLTAMLLTSALDSKARQGQEPFDSHLAENLQEIIDHQRSSLNLKGVSAAVIVPGQGIWQGVSGLSGDSALDPITKEMRFAVASITKTFVAALILELSEEGKLSLRDSLHHWLPGIRHINPNVTIHQLLNHKSGIYNFTNNPSFWEALWLDPQRIWKPEEILQNFLTSPVFPPGSRFEYSNSNYILLGMVVRAVTGSTLVSQLRTRFLTPLGLNDTFFTPEEVVIGDVANNWSDTNNDGILEDLSDVTGPSLYSMVWTAGGISSTAADMVRWAKVLYEGSVLDVAERTEMLTFTDFDNDSPWKGYGLGTMKFIFDGEEMWGHTGLLPGFRSILAYSPATGVSICILVNQDDLASVYTIAPLFYDAVTSIQPTAIAQEREQAAGFVIHNSYPNPFNQSVTIDFDVLTPEHIAVDIFDINGKHVATIVDRYYGVGSHHVRWNAAEFPSGLYVYRFTNDSSSLTRSIMHLK